MTKKQSIPPGQRCREVQPSLFGRSAPEWIVDSVFTGADGIEYSRLVRASDPSQRKTLSVTVLFDRRRFSLVAGETKLGPA